MTLKQGENHQEYRIQDIHLELNVERRLQALGLTEGTIVRVIDNDRRGAMTITFRNTRFAIGSKISTNIEVSELNAS